MKKITIIVDGINKEIEVSNESYNEMLNAIKGDEFRFKPKNGDYYYFIDSLNRIDYEVWNSRNTQKTAYNIGNCYRTKEDAEFALAQYDRRLNNLIIQWKLKYDKVELDWDNTNTFKYYIYYDNFSKKYYVDANRYLQRNIPHFSSKDKAKACIKWLESVL